MPDSTVIDQAVVSKLSGDATLMALTPNGVFVDEGPPGMTRFVVVSLVVAFDEQRFGGRAFEDATYLVKAVMLSTAGGNIAAAAARIDALLDVASLTATGYSPMVCQRVERIRMTEVDEADSAIRWFHRGGRYQVVMSL
jgi:hypothetical protein